MCSAAPGWVTEEQGHLIEHFLGEGGAFDAPDAHLAPAGDGHHVDQSLFGFRLGLEFVVEVFDHLDEAGFGLTLQDDGIGEHAVADSILSDDLLTGNATRSCTFPAVQAGGQAF